MKEEKKSLIIEILNSKFAILVLVLSMFFIATVFAGNVIVNQGSLNVSNNLDVAGATNSTICISNNITRVRAYLSSTQSIPDNTETTVIFNSEDYDTLGEYDTSSGEFTATQAGYYLISSMLTYDNMGAGDFIAAIIAKEGTSITYSMLWGPNFDNADTRTTTVTTTYLNVGEVITIKARHNYGAARDLLGASNSNYVGIVRLP